MFKVTEVFVFKAIKNKLNFKKKKKLREIISLLAVFESDGISINCFSAFLLVK